MSPRIEAISDSMATVTFGNGISESINAAVVASAAAIVRAGMIGVAGVVPSYAALGVHYDPLVMSFADLRERLEIILSETASADRADTGSTLHHIPVSYDGEDIEEVAERTGLSADDVSRIHSEREYQVFVIGFVPGFAYLGPLDERLVLPRRDSPRKRVPPGSVAIAEQQTGIYPSATPGGWHLIGNTDVQLFDAGKRNPTLLRAGDRVKFEAR